MSTHHNGDKIGTLAMQTRQEVQVVSCIVCRKVKQPREKAKVSMASSTTVRSQVIRPSSVVQKVGKQKTRERRETAEVGMTAKVGQTERDGQTVNIGTMHAKVGSKMPAGMNYLESDRSSMMFS